MLDDLKYLRYVLRHKWYVYRAGRKLGCGVVQLLIHDLSKFSKAEWKPYGDRFIRKIENKADFYIALQHHYANNPHHWNFWVDIITEKAFPMPHFYLVEMVADWMGAGKAKTGSWDIIEWYDKNRNKINLHPFTRTVVESLIPGWDEHYNKKLMEDNVYYFTGKVRS